MRIAHVALWTRDIEGHAKFWSKYFGATVGPLYESKRRHGFQSRFAKLAEGPTIELMTGPWLPAQADPDHENTGWSHVAVSVGSKGAVEALAERLDADGLLVSKPRTTGDGYYEAVSRSPDGLLVEIVADM